MRCNNLSPSQKLIFHRNGIPSHDSIDDVAVSPPHTTIKPMKDKNRLPTDMTIKDRHSPNNTVPGRPPKSTLPLRSPPVATQLNQLPGRMNGHAQSYRPESNSALPERPPKPYKIPLNESYNVVPPRPPKNLHDRPSRTPKSGKSLV